MRLEEAYSLQLGEIITAERAYELFWAGTINDKRAFQCPGDDCSAQVTCANLDALEGFYPTTDPMASTSQAAFSTTLPPLPAQGP